MAMMLTGSDWDDRDNEKPARKAVVNAFEIKGRPITNEEVCFP